MPPAAVRPLRRDEIAIAAGTLAAAFDDDPLFRFLLPGASRRQAILHWFHQHAIRECFGVGGAFTLEDGGPATGAIAIVPPGHWPIPLHRTIAALALPRAFPTPNVVRSGLQIEYAIRRLHPASPHVYVYVLGVHPTKKGMGFGAALMRHARALAKEHACVMHLETSNPINLPFYRRFDLEVAHELDAHGGPPVWTMTSRAIERA